MTTFVRIVSPRASSLPAIPGPLFSISDSGIVQTRSTMRIGWTWTESYFFKLDNNSRRFLARATYWFNRGTQLDVQHAALPLLGSGGGTPVVNGASQTGGAIDTTGWPISTNDVLKAGDWITFAGIKTAYQLRNDLDSDGAGAATVNIVPEIFSGGSPANSAAITITDSMVFTVKIRSLVIPEMPADFYISPTITFVEDP